MNLGFWGIQVSNGLQISDASAIFESLGASARQLPILWLGAPVVGLLVQPIIGNLSDQTWSRWGRRQPYFLAGGGVAAIALVFMPNAQQLWLAVVLYWLLQLGLNIGVAPARPFVGDLLPAAQRTRGYAVQSFCIGLGAIIASALPWVLSQLLTFEKTDGVPQVIKLAYYLGASLCLGGSLWTFFTVEEPPPPAADLAPQPRPLDSLRFIAESATQMPAVMKKLGWVQFFTWLGIYSIFLYFPTAVAIDILGVTDKQSEAYAHGVEWAGVCIAGYNLVCLGASSLLPILSRRWGRVNLHALCLLCGSAGLISLLLIHSRYPLLLSMVGVGIAWASILSIPYALLMDALPEGKSGVYMGLFNIFVVLPQMVISLGFGWVMGNFLGDDRTLALALGGICIGIAAVLMLRVPATAPQIGQSRISEEPAS